MKILSQSHQGSELSENELGAIIVDSAVKLHKTLGPGLLESVYEITLARRLSKKGLLVQRQVPVSITFDGEEFTDAFRADLIVNNKVIIELKSVENLHNSSKKQLLTYLKLSSLQLGFLLNFGEELMKSGIIRIINGHLD